MRNTCEFFSNWNSSVLIDNSINRYNLFINNELMYNTSGKLNYFIACEIRAEQQA